MILQKYKSGYPNTYIACAKWLSKTLTPSEYKTFNKQHRYTQAMYLLQFLSLQGFNIINNLDGYSKLDVKVNAVTAIEETIDKGFLKLENNERD